MKLPLALLVFILPLSALAQNPLASASSEAAPGTAAEPTLTVDLQCLSLPQAQALPLIAKLRSQQPAEEAAAVAGIAALLEKGVAKLFAWPTVTTHSRQKGTAEQIEELRYPTQFTAGSASIYLQDTDGSITKQPSRVRGTDLQPVADAFDTRNLGVTLEVEPSVNGTEIELVFKASHVLLKSIDRWAIEHEFTTEKKTEKIIQEQPRFTTYTAQNLIVLKSGEHKLAGVFKTADPEPTLELFILGAEIVERK